MEDRKGDRDSYTLFFSLLIQMSVYA